jgi:ankyrin repeat protein
MTDQPKKREDALSVKFMSAAANGKIEDLGTLLTQDSTLLNAQGYALGTALHFAAGNNQLEAVKFLLKQGASPNIADEHQQLPLDVAHKGSETQKLLNEKTSQVAKATSQARNERGGFTRGDN